MAAFVITRIQTGDYDKWRPMFDQDRPRAREKAQLQRVLRNVDDPNEVFVYLEFSSLDDATEARERLLSSGVLDRFEDTHGPTVLADGAEGVHAQEGAVPVKEASSDETPYGRYITSEGWFVHNLSGALAVRNEEKGGAMYPLEPREAPFGDLGVNVRVLWPGDTNGLYHAEGVQEGFLVLAGECTLIVEEEERPLRQWDYFHCPAGTRHIIVGAGDGPCAILMIGARPEVTIHYPVSEVAAKYGASAAKETDDPDEAYADWPGEYLPVRLAWPLDSDAKP